ncbi:MAG: hypothetical protein ACK4F7_09875 [Inhella sp.]
MHTILANRSQTYETAGQDMNALAIYQTKIRYMGTQMDELERLLAQKACAGQRGSPCGCDAMGQRALL